MVVGEIAVETDVVIIGGGPGGYAAAIRLGQLGKSVVLIEKEEMGGVCLNRGCIPSKALIHAAGQYHQLSQLSSLGIHLPEGNAFFSMPDWKFWKSDVVKTLQKGVTQLCEANGVTIVKGNAIFLSSDRIGVETDGDFERFTFQHAIIATGSRPYIPSPLHTDGAVILDSTDVLQLDRVPESLAIIGGGYIGMEIGMAFAKLGAEVTIIEAAERILSQVSAHLTQDVVKHAKKLGMRIKTSSKVEAITVENGFAHVNISSEKGDKEIIVHEKALITIGRIPNTNEIGLKQAGIDLDERGYIPVDQTGRTNQRHIFAIGDTTTGPALAHRAAKQGVVAAESIAGLPTSFDTPFIPYVIFTEPQIAGVGLTKEQAVERGYQVKSASFPYRGNGRAITTGAGNGFAEVIVDAKTHVLLGMHIVGEDASNLIGEGVLALEMAARVEDLAWTIHAHPTLSEMWQEAAEGVLGYAIHMLNKND